MDQTNFFSFVDIFQITTFDSKLIKLKKHGKPKPFFHFINSVLGWEKEEIFGSRFFFLIFSIIITDRLNI